MNMRTKLIVACLFICFGLAGHALAAMDEIKEPELSFPDSFPAAARVKVMAALNQPDCKFLGGMWLNGFTSLRYKGETMPLNLLLKSLAECAGITLTIRFQEFSDDVGFDWLVSQEPAEWLKGHDKVRSVSVCVDVNLKSSRIKMWKLHMPDYKGPNLPKTK